jgi:hypothetical protein
MRRSRKKSEDKERVTIKFFANFEPVYVMLVWYLKKKKLFFVENKGGEKKKDKGSKMKM